MAEKVYMKVGDLEPDLVLALWDGEDEDTRTPATGLADADEIVFIMSSRAGKKIDRRAMSLDPAVDGVQNVVRMAWQAGDSDTAGTFKGEVEAVWPGNRPQTWPKRKTLQVIFEADQG